MGGMSRDNPQSTKVTIRTMVESDRGEWVRLRRALWPGSLSDHDVETRKYFESRSSGRITFGAEADGSLVGFLELDYRKYAPGCASSPVAFIEGLYVEPMLQRRGVGGALVEAAEASARAQGDLEIASDAELENTDGIAAHVALGYEEVERVVCFRKSLHIADRRPRMPPDDLQGRHMTSRTLIAMATNLARPFAPSVDCRSGDVAAALLTGAGNVYTGICVDTECGLGFCAEHSAIADMLKAHECVIRMIVAVDQAGIILSPCGRCRELMWQVSPMNSETEIVLGPDRLARLTDLLPCR